MPRILYSSATRTGEPNWRIRSIPTYTYRAKVIGIPREAPWSLLIGRGDNPRAGDIYYPLGAAEAGNLRSLCAPARARSDPEPVTNARGP